MDCIEQTIHISRLDMNFGETDLTKLLNSLSPELSHDEYVFCSLKGNYGDFAELKPIASFQETEGLTLIITKEAAESHNIDFASTHRLITLKAHSSLDAVGLTAAVSRELADSQISENVVAASYHEHIFVDSKKAELALQVLIALSESHV